MDNKCFLYSILAIIKYNLIPFSRDRVQHYLPYLDELNYEGLEFPMKLSIFQILSVKTQPWLSM